MTYLFRVRQSISLPKAHAGALVASTTGALQEGELHLLLLRLAEEVVQTLEQSLLRGHRHTVVLDLEEAILSGGFPNLGNDFLPVTRRLWVKIGTEVDKGELNFVGHFF